MIVLRRCSGFNRSEEKDHRRFDKQVAHNLGGFFDKVFLPTMKKLVEAELSYDEVKRVVKIPTTWGAKISGSSFGSR